MSNTRTLLKRNVEVQEIHDEAFDRAFAIRREAERILRQKRAQVRITVLNEKRDLPI